MNYAIIKTGGKQYKVSKGSILEIEKLPNVDKGGKVAFDKVLLYVDGDDMQLGAPFLSNAVITAKVLDLTRGKKLRVARFKAKSNYRKVKGHRQYLSKIQVEDIKLSKKDSPKKGS